MMAMATDFVNDDERDETLSTDAEKQIEATLFKQGQDYADRNKRSKIENEGRAESRKKIKAIGMDPNAYATAIRLIKDKTPRELQDWRRDFELTLKVMGSKQRELFPDEQLKAEARIQRAKDKAAGKPRDKSELDANTDTNRKSDPNTGGAQVDIEETIAAQTEKELAEGAALLEGKSDAWRAGFNAVAAGGERGSNPFMEGGAESRDWFAGYEVATQRAFDAAAPKSEFTEAEAYAPAEPIVVDGAVFNAGAGKPAAPKAKKPSQSEKAQAKRDAAQVP
jgi:hypothetical protein